MKARPALPLFAALVAGAASAACATSTPPQPARTNAARQDWLDARAPRPVSSDEGIVRVLIRELQGDHFVGRERIDADCRNGILTLQGDVSNVLAKRRAVAIAQVVDGVRAVIDRMAIAARSRSDSELEFAAANALAADAATIHERIGAHARVGVVRLTGPVDSNATRRIAEDDVLAIPGVLEVIDDLAVVPSKRDDAQVASEIQRILRDDPWLDDQGVRVSVRAGIVTLAGSVKSAAQSARAEDDARESSPDGVDLTALRIDPAQDGTRRSGTALAPTDEQLATAIRDAYLRDPRVRAFAPEVEVHDGVALLAGEMPDADTVRAATDDAVNVPGMASARDALSVSSPVAQSDSVVLSEVGGAIDRDPRLSRRVIVDVRNGRVFLRGSVTSEEDRLRALAAATSVRGARGVDDSLMVDQVTLAGRAR